MRMLVIGAGAVGRGFVAPLLTAHGVGVDFVDTNRALLAALSARKSYLTAVAGPRGYELTRVICVRALSPEALTDVGRYDAVFVSTGPRQFLACAPLLREARAVFVLENLRAAAEQLRAAASNARIWFGIPDVVVSSTAPPTLLARDPLCLVAEPGDLILEQGCEPLGLERGVIWADASEFEQHWAAKFFIHNASHAVAAFLGSLAGHRLVHEAMADPRIDVLVECTIRSITRAVVAQGLADARFAASYMERELQRFRNPPLRSDQPCGARSTAEAWTAGPPHVGARARDHGRGGRVPDRDGNRCGTPLPRAGRGPPASRSTSLRDHAAQCLRPLGRKPNPRNPRLRGRLGARCERSTASFHSSRK